MTPHELDRLWDPAAPTAESDVVRVLEEQLRSLRGPASLPHLELPPRTQAFESPGAQHRFDRWALVASLLLVAGVLLTLFASDSRPESDPASSPLARAQEAAPPSTDPQAWRVEAFVGEQMCQAPGVEAAVQEGEALPNDTPFDTGPGSTARLRRGDAVVDLHPNSQIRQVEGILQLSYGRLWAELPERAEGEAWELRAPGATLSTRGARFVWWAFETEGGDVGVPFRASDEMGVELVSGELVWTVGDEGVVLRPGQRCYARMDAQARTPSCE